MYFVLSTWLLHHIRVQSLVLLILENKFSVWCLSGLPYQGQCESSTHLPLDVSNVGPVGQWATWCIKCWGRELLSASIFVWVRQILGTIRGPRVLIDRAACNAWKLRGGVWCQGPVTSTLCSSAINTEMLLTSFHNAFSLRGTIVSDSNLGECNKLGVSCFLWICFKSIIKRKLVISDVCVFLQKSDSQNAHGIQVWAIVSYDHKQKC